MIIKINRLSITNPQIVSKVMKNNGENAIIKYQYFLRLPAIISNIIKFQFSPVAHLNNVNIAIPKLLKLLYFETINPLSTLLNKKTPRTEYMKKTSISKAPILINDGSE